MVYEQVDHIVLFRLCARIDARDLEIESKLRAIESAVTALKETCDKICEYEEDDVQKVDRGVYAAKRLLRSVPES